MNSNRLFSDLLDTVLKSKIDALLDLKEQFKLEPDEYHATDNFGEVLEKLAILHIRTWHLEDAIQKAETAEEMADLKKKIDICFKVKRPKLVEGLNAMIDDAITKHKSLREDSVKLYKDLR